MTMSIKCDELIYDVQSVELNVCKTWNSWRNKMLLRDDKTTTCNHANKPEETSKSSDGT